MNESNISFKGWLIRMTEERDDDVVKIYHEAYAPGTWDVGRRDLGNPKDSTSIDVSPYSSSIIECCAMIELGLPTRRDIKGSVSPLNREDIEKLWLKRFGNPLPTKFAFAIIN